MTLVFFAWWKGCDIYKPLFGWNDNWLSAESLRFQKRSFLRPTKRKRHKSLPTRPANSTDDQPHPGWKGPSEQEDKSQRWLLCEFSWATCGQIHSHESVHNLCKQNRHIHDKKRRTLWGLLPWKKTKHKLVLSAAKTREAVLGQLRVQCPLWCFSPRWKS